MTTTQAAIMAATAGGAGYFAWVLTCGAVGLVAIIRILRQPADHWKHRNWSKLAWILAILYLAPPLGGYPIPIGAIAAIHATRNRTNRAADGQVRRAEGSTDWPFPWETK